MNKLAVITCLFLLPLGAIAEYVERVVLHPNFRNEKSAEAKVWHVEYAFNPETHQGILSFHKKGEPAAYSYLPEVGGQFFDRAWIKDIPPMGECVCIEWGRGASLKQLEIFWLNPEQELVCVLSEAGFYGYAFIPPSESDYPFDILIMDRTLGGARDKPQVHRFRWDDNRFTRIDTQVLDSVDALEAYLVKTGADE